MTDRREDIMTYIQTVLLPQVQGIVGVYRNRNELPPEEKTPGIILLDGVEKLKTQVEGHNFTAMPVAVFTLRPQIILALTPRTDPDNTILPNGTVLPVGTELSSFLTKIKSAMINDDTLVAMLGDNGSIVYEGFDSDMQNGSTIGSLGAVMQINFAISYVLNASEL